MEKETILFNNEVYKKLEVTPKERIKNREEIRKKRVNLRKLESRKIKINQALKIILEDSELINSLKSGEHNISLFHYRARTGLNYSKQNICLTLSDKGIEYTSTSLDGDDYSNRGGIICLTETKRLRIYPIPRLYEITISNVISELKERGTNGNEILSNLESEIDSYMSISYRISVHN